ncbi:hypothetical protein Agub_g12465 [Astrephomene gubernaculifera]|uniref:Kinesin motor domain-containing protein n=1 Tax=Astrephomene gubernaculifera TaxID=47775 RepID=A0AAD3DYP7_9CHLO|nr:hypothetical protein Agub_g12465 [Astrephomene gubernaculifera]
MAGGDTRAMQKFDVQANDMSPSSEESSRTPNENDLLITRLVARIAELEEKLYKKELEAPEIGQRAAAPEAAPLGTPGGAPAQQQQQQPQQQPSKLRDSILATLRESWAKLESHTASVVQTPPPAVPSMPYAAPPPPASAPAAGPVSTPPRAATPTGAAAAAAAIAATAMTPRRGDLVGSLMTQAETAEGQGAASGTPIAAANDVNGGGAEGSKEAGGSFQFATHLVVDYNKPTPGARDARDGANTAACSPSHSGGSAGTPSSLSSIDSSAMGYGAGDSADQQKQQRDSGKVLNMGSAGTSSTATSANMTSKPAGGSGGAGCTSAPLTPGGTAAGGAPNASGSTPSRAAAWSGSVLSKLGIAWGRDKDNNSSNSRDGRDNRSEQGGGMSRVVSAGSLQSSGGPQHYQHAESFSEKALEQHLGALGAALTGGGTGGGGGHYYRYVFDPADLQAEMEVTARVRRAAAEALTEANAKLAEAQAAAAALQQQVEQAKELEQELEQLRAEQAAVQAAKAALEDDAAAVRRQLEAMKETEASLQAELEGMRSQADIWSSSKDDEAEKLKQENALLRNQLAARLSELQTCRGRVSEGEAERQRLQREAEDLQNKIKWLSKINLQLEAAASQLDEARKAAGEWQERFMRERNVRRRLHDQLQQLRGNIRVLCRVRPVQVGQRDIVSYPLEGLLAVSPPDRRYQEFEFDHVFPPSSGQCSVFEEAVGCLVRSVADGHSACILAYGQTGSGKTYTMQGPPEDPGIYFRALQELFRIATEEDGAAAAAAAATALTSSANPTAPAAATVGSSSSSTTTTATATAQTTPTVASASPRGATTRRRRSSSSSGTGLLPATSSGDVSAAAAAAAAADDPAATLGRFSFHVSMLEIYNEAVHDLLAGSGSSGPMGQADGAAGDTGAAAAGEGMAATAGAAASSKPLEVSALGAGELPPGVDRVPGLTWRPVASTAAVEALLREGGRNRATAATASNAHSSRSHALLSVRVTVTGADGRRAVSVLHLVDLAGSERVDKSEVTGQQLKEAQSINRSLSALGDVISALQRRSPHVPFRNSKLTAVLQDALCGNSKVLLVCNIAPESTSASETLSSLNFASRAAQVELGSAASRRTSSDRHQLPAPAPPPPSAASAQPPLPIMNGTAAKVRAAAAAAAAASGNGGGSGGAASARPSPSWNAR